jgi:hypothetical protein
MPENLRLLILCFKNIIKNMRRPHRAKTANHTHYPHCFTLSLKKERKYIEKQHEKTPRAFHRFRAIPTAFPLYPHFLGCIPTAPLGAARRHRRRYEASPGCKGGIARL